MPAAYVSLNSLVATFRKKLIHLLIFYLTKIFQILSFQHAFDLNIYNTHIYHNIYITSIFIYTIIFLYIFIFLYFKYILY